MPPEVKRTAASARSWPGALAVAVASALIGLWRLWLANPDAITTVLWAEDGLLPLCVRKAGFLGCIVDPFAGYWMAIPRLVAGGVALLPLSTWPFAQNLLAASLGGLLAAANVVILRRFGLSWFVTVVVALLPVLIPIVGLEALGVVASIYMPMLFTSTLALAFATRGSGRWWVAVLLLLTALTIPSAALLVLVVAFQGIRRRIDLRTSVIWICALVVGVVAQLLIAASAAKPRELIVGWDSAIRWVDGVPNALLTFWPGLTVGEQVVFDNYVTRPASWAGVVVVAVIVILGLAGAMRADARRSAVGLLLLTGVVLGAFPSLIGFANNRYFVVPCLLWAAAALVALEPVIARSRWWVVALVCAAVIAVWWPAMPASAWRTTAAPDWRGEAERVVVHCKSAPDIHERFVFSPFWPPNWGDGLAEPSHPDVACLDVWSWE